MSGIRQFAKLWKKQESRIALPMTCPRVDSNGGHDHVGSDLDVHLKYACSLFAMVKRNSKYNCFLLLANRTERNYLHFLHTKFSVLCCSKSKVARKTFDEEASHSIRHERV